MGLIAQERTVYRAVGTFIPTLHCGLLSTIPLPSLKLGEDMGLSVGPSAMAKDLMPHY